MFVEERVYTMRSGRSRDFIKDYEETGREIQELCLGKTLGAYNTQFGAANQIVMMWKFDSLQDRNERFETLLQRKDWQEYLERNHPFVLKMENKMLVPLPFFKTRLKSPTDV